jgi:hypothetical protein
MCLAADEFGEASCRLRTCDVTPRPNPLIRRGYQGQISPILDNAPFRVVFGRLNTPASTGFSKIKASRYYTTVH